MSLREHVHCGYASNFCQNCNLVTFENISRSHTEHQNSQHRTQGAKGEKSIIDYHEKFEHVQGT